VARSDVGIPLPEEFHRVNMVGGMVEWKPFIIDKQVEKVAARRRKAAMGTGSLKKLLGLVEEYAWM